MIATCRVKGLGHFRAEGLAKLLSRSTHAKAGRDENLSAGASNTRGLG